MYKIVNRFLLVGDKFMSKIRLKQPGSTYSAFGPVTNAKEECKILKKQKIQYISIKTNQAKRVFIMIYLIEILKIYLDKQVLTKFSVIKHLILLKIKIMLDINAKLFLQFANFLINGLLITQEQELFINIMHKIQELADELQKPIITKFK